MLFVSLLISIGAGTYQFSGSQLPNPNKEDGQTTPKIAVVHPRRWKSELKTDMKNWSNQTELPAEAEAVYLQSCAQDVYFPFVSIQG